MADSVLTAYVRAAARFAAQREWRRQSLGGDIDVDQLADAIAAELLDDLAERHEQVVKDADRAEDDWLTHVVLATEYRQAANDLRPVPVGRHRLRTEDVRP